MVIFYHTVDLATSARFCLSSGDNCISLSSKEASGPCTSVSGVFAVDEAYLSLLRVYIYIHTKILQVQTTKERKEENSQCVTKFSSCKIDLSRPSSPDLGATVKCSDVVLCQVYRKYH